MSYAFSVGGRANGGLSGMVCIRDGTFESSNPRIHESSQRFQIMRLGCDLHSEMFNLNTSSYNINFKQIAIANPPQEIRVGWIHQPGLFVS